MSKFKVGDLIVGLPHNGYGYTTDKMVCQVLETYGGNSIEVVPVKALIPQLEKYVTINCKTHVNGQQFKLYVEDIGSTDRKQIIPFDSLQKGDYVIIRPDLKEYIAENGDAWPQTTSNLLSNAGKPVAVAQVLPGVPCGTGKIETAIVIDGGWYLAKWQVSTCFRATVAIKNHIDNGVYKAPVAFTALKIGDKVIIREDLTTKVTNTTPSMLVHKGAVRTVKTVLGPNTIKLKGVTPGYSWNPQHIAAAYRETPLLTPDQVKKGAVIVIKESIATESHGCCPDSSHPMAKLGGMIGIVTTGDADSCTIDIDSSEYAWHCDAFANVIMQEDKYEAVDAALPIGGGLDMAVFKSPQTGSAFNVVLDFADVKVCFRDLNKSGEQGYRIRIQGTKSNLPTIKQNLLHPGAWSAVKDGDHISVVVADQENLKNALADASNAVIKFAL